MQNVAIVQVVFPSWKYTRCSKRNNTVKISRRRVPDALSSKCSEVGNISSGIRPPYDAYLFSIRDDVGASGLTDCAKSYCGIIELTTPAPTPDASWKTTLEHVRNMDLSGKHVSVTNISDIINDSWIEVVTAFHESGANSVQYKTTHVFSSNCDFSEYCSKTYSKIIVETSEK